MQIDRRLPGALLLTAVLVSLASVGTAPAMAAPQEQSGSYVGGGERAPAATLRPYELPPPPRLRLAPLPAAGPSPRAAPGRPLQVGEVRWLAAAERRRARPAELDWERHPRGRVAALSVESPGARSVRVGLRIGTWPEGTELRVFGHGADRRVHGPLAPDVPASPQGRSHPGGRDAEALFWTPLVDGETASLELRLPPGVRPGQLDIQVEAIGHVTISPFAGLRNLAHVGNAGSCNQGVRCTDVGAVRDSVAKILFVSGGGLFLCTGQLLASEDGPAALLSTANHCISGAGEARSIDLFWLFERAVCEGPEPTSVLQTNGGRLLHTADVDVATDFTLIQLLDPPPAGAFRSGWTAVPPDNGSDVITIHHPAGDLKMASEGSIQGREPWDSQEFPSHYRVFWSAGITEGGSSGGGLWVDDRFVGVLTGGSSSCSSPRAPDLFGRFDLTFPDLRGWLDPGRLRRLRRGSSVSRPVDSGGWLHYRVVGSFGRVRVEVRPRSGNPDLYVDRSMAPGLDSFECRSDRRAGATDVCNVQVVGGDAYVGVYGASAATFDLVIFETTAGGGELGVPQPVSPAGESDSRPAYEWSPVDGAVAYELQVRSVSGTVHGARHRAAPMCDDDGCRVSSPPVDALSPGAHWWRVRAVDEPRVGAWSEERGFQVSAASRRIGRAPRPLRPRGRVVTSEVIYEWIPAADADAYRVEVRVGGEVLMQRQVPADICVEGLCSWDPPGSVDLPAGRQRWGVRARVDGEWGPQRNNRYNLVLGAPRLVTPVGVTVDRSPAFQWTPVAGAVRYLLRLRDRQGVVVSRWVPAATVCEDEICRVTDLVDSLAPGEYSWRVRPGDPVPTAGRSDLGRFHVQ